MNDLPGGETSSGAEDIFSELAVSEESVQRFLNQKSLHDASKHVCLCGHAINKHNKDSGGWMFCTTARHDCPCSKITPVLFASDTRYFMRKTYGPGSRHALSTGLARLRQLGKTAFWLEKPKCMRVDCKRTNNHIYPVAMDRDYVIVDLPGAINLFLCETCFLIEKGVPGNEGKGWIW